MRRFTQSFIALLIITAVLCCSIATTAAAAATQTQKEVYLSPAALAAADDGKTLFIACATANQVAVFDADRNQITRTIAVPDSPSGLALAADGSLLYVTCAAPESTVCVVDLERGKIISKIRTGHTAMAPILSPDGKTLYICNRFNNAVSFIDLATRTETRRVSVPREPVAAAITKDGQALLVANHIHAGRSDQDFVASSVSVIDTKAGRVVKEIVLPNGSGLLRDIRVSPDGRFACVTHLLSRYHLPTTQVERGWINSNALTLIDLAEMKLVNTVLLDNIDSGAANPWAAAWTADGKNICVTHAGTHELSVIDVDGVLKKLARIPATLDPAQPGDYGSATRMASDVPNDLAFLVGLRQRVKLSEKDRSPRAVAIIGRRAWVANYFSDTLSVIDLAAAGPCVRSIPLRAEKELTTVRRGEALFNDATICFQGWQSCASCHSSDARVDGLNWDNLNDGIGNPKNVKSLLLAHQTPPSMWLGVRSNAYAAVRAGIRHSLFTVQPEADAVALDEYLKSLRPIPSPHLINGKLSAAAERGQRLFRDEKVGCAECHKGSLLTDQKFHDVSTRGRFDKPAEKYDTPTLIEAWRSGPYLHDGSAATVRDVLTTRNKDDEHGATAHLSREQIDDLVMYLLSL